MSDTNDNAQDTDAEGLAARNGISIDEARRLIEEIGHDTSKLDAAAQKSKLEP